MQIIREQTFYMSSSPVNSVALALLKDIASKVEKVESMTLETRDKVVHIESKDYALQIKDINERIEKTLHEINAIKTDVAILKLSSSGWLKGLNIFVVALVSGIVSYLVKHFP